jgi:hypothetical protein
MGAHSMCGFQSHVSQDIPPFMMVDGNPLGVRGFNIEGLRRRGFGRRGSPRSSRCIACSTATAVVRRRQAQDRRARRPSRRPPTTSR